MTNTGVKEINHPSAKEVFTTIGKVNFIPAQMGDPLKSWVPHKPSDDKAHFAPAADTYEPIQNEGKQTETQQSNENASQNKTSLESITQLQSPIDSGSGKIISEGLDGISNKRRLDSNEANNEQISNKKKKVESEVESSIEKANPDPINSGSTPTDEVNSEKDVKSVVGPPLTSENKTQADETINSGDINSNVESSSSVVEQTESPKQSIVEKIVASESTPVKVVSVKTAKSRIGTSNRRNGKNSSRYRGVCWLPDRKSWRSRIEIRGKREHLGYFESEEAAAMAYDERAIMRYGDSVSFLNFPQRHQLIKLKLEREESERKAKEERDSFRKKLEQQQSQNVRFQQALYNKKLLEQQSRGMQPVQAMGVQPTPASPWVYRQPYTAMQPMLQPTAIQMDPSQLQNNNMFLPANAQFPQYQQYQQALYQQQLQQQGNTQQVPTMQMHTPQAYPVQLSQPQVSQQLPQQTIQGQPQGTMTSPLMNGQSFVPNPMFVNGVQYMPQMVSKPFVPNGQPMVQQQDVNATSHQNPVNSYVQYINPSNGQMYSMPNQR